MSDEEREEEKPFAVERAKTGRAKCKKCKCPIDKDTVRIAKLMANPFSEGKMKAWHHLSCLFEVFAKQRATTKRIEDPEEDVSGWQELSAEDKKIVLERIEEFENNAPFKNIKKTAPKAASTSTSRKRSLDKTSNGDTTQKPKKTKKDDSIEIAKSAKKEKNDGGKSTKSVPTKDDAFRLFRKVCTDVADVDAYTEKTAIVRKMLKSGSSGDGFKGDVKLWCKLLLPGVVKRIYKLQSKQLVKLFARLLNEDEDEMLEHLEQGDVAETIRQFFERSSAVQPASKSLLTIQEVDEFLEILSSLTKEEEQMRHFRTIMPRCTANDLRMIVRLIKHDLRINAGAKHILNAVHEDANTAFQTSRDLNSVLERCLEDTSCFKSPAKSPSGSPATNKVALSLMTPVLPMLAQACKSVSQAIKKCPYGMLSEVKYDGERVQVHKKGDEFRYFSRALKPVMPHKVNLFKKYIPKAFPQASDLILDSEVLMIDTKTGQPLPFGSLGIHKKSEFKDANVCLFVFDCIYYNGEVLLHKTMNERRQILQERMTEIPNRIVLSEVQRVNDPQDLAQMIAKVLKLGLEGLVLKDVHGKYEPGKRHWLKVKKDYLCDGAMADTADLVVLGAWYGTGHKGGMMSVFLMGCYDEEHDKWLTVTKVHTGHDDATLLKLQDELDMVKIAQNRAKVPSWLRANKPMIPDFVARDPKKQPVWEITGAEFTNQGVHTADGISIRFPRVTRIRADKDWSTATTLNELRNLFKTSSESIDFSLLLSSDKDEKKDVGNNKPTTLDSFVQRGSTSDDINVATDKKRKRIDEAKPDSISGKNDYSHRMSKRRSGKSTENKEIQGSEDEDEERAEYYSFVNNDYIEYTAAGSPLNWIEGRKPPKGLPSDAKPLSSLVKCKLRSKAVLGNVCAAFGMDFEKRDLEKYRMILKTLGAKILESQEEAKTCTHVIHASREIVASVLEEYRDYSRTVRHVSVSWIEASATASKMQNPEEHAIKLVPEYCICP